MRKILQSILVTAALITARNVSANVVTHWPTTQPASVAVNQPNAIYCPDLRSFLMALQTARRTPNTHIKLAPVDYHVASEIIVNGDGTTIDGNGATLISTASYTGRINPLTNEPATGTVLFVEPILGKPVPFNKQTNGLWLNPPGHCVALNKAAGGSYEPFFERAPCQDASGKLMADYSQFAPYLVPARNITIENINIKYASPHCDGAVTAKYSQNITFRKIHVLNMPQDLGKTISHGDLWSDGSQWVTFDQCEGPVAIEMNSSLWCHVINCKVACSTYEEACRFCITEKSTLNSIRTNDILCTDIIFDSNTLLLKGNDTGAIWGGVRITFTNNTCAGGVWCGQTDARQCLIKGNRGTVFVDMGAKSSGNVIGANP